MPHIQHSLVRIPGRIHRFQEWEDLRSPLRVCVGYGREERLIPASETSTSGFPRMAMALASDSGQLSLSLILS